MEKRDHMPDMFTKTDLDAMQRLREAIDPQGLANRGKMFPQGVEDPGSAADREAPALHTHGPHPLKRAGKISDE